MKIAFRFKSEMKHSMKTNVLIIGGGMAGIRLACLLADLKIDFHLLEARDRFGGRILTDHMNGSAFDLGPAWFWPGQPRMEALVKTHGIDVFSQHAEGHLSYENEQGVVQRGRGQASMQGSLRLDGGFGLLIDIMVRTLPESALGLNQTVTRLQLDGSVIVARTNTADFVATHVVLALPPRLVAEHIQFEPFLPPAALQELQSVPTWMAGQAKALAIYDEAFWRKDGLSGDAMSRRGPMVEIHDATPARGANGGLFGFIGVAPHQRQNDALLRAAILEQLQRIFGPKAGRPVGLMIKDWAFDVCTASSLDLAPLYSHPGYGMSLAFPKPWEGRLFLAGTESASQFGGYVEGALASAETAMGWIRENTG